MSNIIYGQTSVQNPGTAEKLTEQEIGNHVVTIKADSSNENSIHVGDALVNWDDNPGFVLAPGEEVSIFVDFDADIYIDSEEQYATVSFIGWIKHRNRP